MEWKQKKLLLEDDKFIYTHPRKSKRTHQKIVIIPLKNLGADLIT